MNDTSRITDFLNIMSRLIGVLEREIELLRAMKPVEFQNLQQDKIVLAAAYEAHVKALGADAQALAQVAPQLRTEVTAAMERFRKALDANERALRAAKETTDRVLRAVVEEIAQQRRENVGYSASGTVGSHGRTGPKDPVSVAINERF